MIFLIVGAPIVFIIGMSIGICITILFLALMLCYANNIPLTQNFGLHIGVEMYLQMAKFWFKLTRKKSRITPKMIRKSMNLTDLKNTTKYPFVRVLPMTSPTQDAKFWDSLLYQQKQLNFVAELAKPYKHTRVQKLRDQMSFSEPMFNMIDNNTKIEIETIKNTKCHWISYQGSDINNGIILSIHGGGYVSGMASMQYSLCSYLSKLTGCYCLSIDYKLCPEQLITDIVDEVYNIYSHLITEHLVSSSQKISIMGESAGGGIALLLLQKIRDSKLSSPACCWVNSPWTDLSMESDTVKHNCEIDAMLVNDSQKYFQRMSVGEIDKYAKAIMKNGYDEGKKDLLKKACFSPLYGNWNDLCPIYFMCGATEMLLNDTLSAAKKAYDAGVNVKVDIEPYMHHTWALFLRTLPEATYAVVRASDFILFHTAKV